MAVPRPPRRGEVWLTHTPYHPDDPHQPRPALVISTNGRNAHRDDVMVVPIYSRGALGPTRVPIDSPEGGISHDSVLFCEEMTTVLQDLFEDGPLGRTVSDELLRRVVAGIRRAVGDFVPFPDP